MGDVHKLDEAFNWPVTRLADFFGIHRQTMAKRLQEAGTQPAGEVKGNPVYALKDAAKAVYGAPGSNGAGLDLDQYPEARKAWYQSENERIKFETSIGGLIREEEHARALAFMAKSFAASLESLADQLEREAGLPPEAVVTVQQVCDGARERTYEALMAYRGESLEDN